MKNRIEILKRKNIGRSKLSYNYEFFKSYFKELHHIDLEESDKILNNLDFKYTSNEIIQENSLFQKTILSTIYNQISNTEQSYIFTDDFEYCGMFLVNTKKALEHSLVIAKEDRNQTFFILDYNKKFYIRINYYDGLHTDFPLMYDIMIKYTQIKL